VQPLPHEPRPHDVPLFTVKTLSAKLQIGFSPPSSIAQLMPPAKRQTAPDPPSEVKHVMVGAQLPGMPNWPTTTQLQKPATQLQS